MSIVEKSYTNNPLYADRIVRVPAVGLTMMVLNQNNEFLKNQKVRQAIAQAIDMDQIIQGIYGGEAQQEKASMIFWGPPGVGKTTLAYIISKQVKRQFFQLSAVSSGVKEVREVIDRARMAPEAPILFIDEIHRFSKSQQDSLLGAVERGLVTLIGATTENPSFEVISPLLSRCQVYVLKSLEKEDLEILLAKAVKALEYDFGKKIIVKEPEALMKISGGDGRKLLNAIELVVTSLNDLDMTAEELVITNDFTTDCIQSNLVKYDKQGEMHYDIISAFIKSMRGSDPNAALYYLARMIEAGEDPLFIARRMLILASEDIGNANPNALLLANACFDAVNKIGWPESRKTLVIMMVTSMPMPTKATLWSKNLCQLKFLARFCMYHKTTLASANCART